MSKVRYEVIVDVSAEGGGVTLYGVRTKNGWLFSRGVIDQTLLLLGEAEIRLNWAAGPAVPPDTLQCYQASLELSSPLRGAQSSCQLARAVPCPP